MTDETPEASLDEAALGELKSVMRADVYKAGDVAAHLTRARAGQVVFSYSRDWIRNAGDPVATTLPVTEQDVVMTGGAVPAFFAGLLPEGRRLGALRHSLKTSADDELTLVLGVGGDTIGDVCVLPEGQRPQSVPPRLRVTSFQEVRFADLLAEMGVTVDRRGLPGIQDKVSAAMLNLPVTAAGSDLILKLNPREFKHLVENEHFFLACARRAGITTVEAQLVEDRDGAPGLAVARFDRVVVNGVVTSLAVEDGCQVLGLHPEAKYRLTTEEVLGRLCSVCEARVPAAAVFLAQIVFAYVSGNGDAHAKNFSVFRDPSGRWQPAPAYDLPSSQPYGDTTMALSIAGKRDGNVPGERFVALAGDLGVPARAARAVITQVASSVDLWLDSLGELPFDRGTIAKLTRVVRNRQRMLSRA